jgi:hypothetical protein
MAAAITAVPPQSQWFMNEQQLEPLAITMWEFSWLERRWAGAGYEDWDKALKELTERGYNAVRIDAFPHLLANDANKTYKLLPHWDNQMWGSPFYTEVTVMPALVEFLQKCKQYKVKVALSTWWREDADETAKKITSGKELGIVWQKTLSLIEQAGLLDTILFVDISNEYPITVWTPYLPNNTQRSDAIAQQYMKEVYDLLTAAYKDIPVCFSITSEFEKYKTENVSKQDLLELHIWIANCTDFYKEVGYDFEFFGNTKYKELQLNGERVYRSKEQFWLGELQKRIAMCAEWSVNTSLPLVTTECWGPIDYKDMPLLKWDWVKESCAFGTKQSAATGRWLAIATSNFCGPQFPGMWQDVEWHRQLTTFIKKSKPHPSLMGSKLAKRMLQIQNR